MSVDLVTAAVKKAIATTAAVQQDHREPAFNY